METNQKVKNFLMRLAQEKELREKIEAAVKCHDKKEWITLSKKAGFDFTQTDLEYLHNLVKAYQNGELSEEQLEMVAGGGSFVRNGDGQQWFI